VRQLEWQLCRAGWRKRAGAAKVSRAAAFFRARWRSARALPCDKQAINLPRGGFGASVGDALRFFLLYRLTVWLAIMVIDECQIEKNKKKRE
jgi:hypothetical protein